MQPARLCLLLSIVLLGEAAEYRNPAIVTSAPIHVSEQYQSHLLHQQQQQPAVLTQSYQVLPEPRNYYPYPQYLPTHTGYTNIQSVGQPYQMYGGAAPGSDASSYGLSAPSPAPSPSPSTVPHRSVSVTPIPPSPFENRPSPSVEHQHSRSPSHHHSSARNQALVQGPFAPKPILSYGATNPFLANLPPAQGIYGAPVEDSSHRGDAIRAFYELNPLSGYDGASAPAAAPPSSASIDDTWEALEASVDASTRRRHRFNWIPTWSCHFSVKMNSSSGKRKINILYLDYSLIIT